MIAITGATGNIGAEVVRLLLEAKQPVRVLVRDPNKVKHLEGRAEIVKADLSQPETLSAGFAGATRAFILVANIHEIPTASGAIFQAAERAGVKHTVFISSGTIGISPATVIGGWHLEGERLLKATKMSWTMLRPGNFASNSLRWAGMIKAQGSVFSAHASHQSAVIDPRDIAAVAAKALSTSGHENKTYTLTGPTPMTAVEQVQLLAAALNKPIKLIEVPEAGARAGMLKGGLTEQLADAILELTAPGHTIDQLVTTTVTDVTGKPARSYSEWARDHAAAFH